LTEVSRDKKLAAGASRPPETKPSSEERQVSDPTHAGGIKAGLFAPTLTVKTEGNT